MKKEILQPTDDNVRNAFIRNSLGRNQDLLQFIKLINAMDESYSIALDSYWGSGKTFFVKQIKLIYDTMCESPFVNVVGKEQIENVWSSICGNDPLISHIAIYYDAWENDCDDDPIYSLVYQMALETQNTKGLKERADFSDVLTIAGKITNAIAGVDPKEIADSIQKTHFLEALKERKEIQQRIKEYISKLLPTGYDRLLIIVDELDRCNPSFAIKLLERIKHYFDNDRVTFLFSVNLAELQISIRKYYGEEFNASRYLERFFDMRIPLPPVNNNVFYQLIGQNELGIWNNIAELVIQKNHLQIRESIKYISMLKILKTTSFLTEEFGCNFRDNTKIVLYKVVIPIVWGEMLSNIFLYNRFMNESDYSLLTSFFNDIDSIIAVQNSIKYLFAQNEMANYNSKIHTSEGIQLVHEKIKEFYNALMSDDNSEIEVGQCLITTSGRQSFQKTVSLLENSISFKDTNMTHA